MAHPVDDPAAAFERITDAPVRRRLRLLGDAGAVSGPLAAAAAADGCPAVPLVPLVLTKHSLEALLGIRRHPLREVLHRWRRAGQRFDDSVRRWFGRSSIADCSGVVGHVPGFDAMVFRSLDPSFGRSEPYRFYDFATWRQMVGRPVAALPDSGFGMSLDASYREILSLCEPEFATADALVLGSDRVVRRRRYQRLVLPWFDAEGRPILTFSSVPEAALCHTPVQAAARPVRHG